MRRRSYPLRLQRSLMEEARKAAASEGVSLNQLINVAVAEKVSALRTEIYLYERIRRADEEETLRILDRAVRGDPPMEGDELLSGGPSFAAQDKPFGTQGEPFGAQGKQAQPARPPDWAPDGERAGEIAKPAGRATSRFAMLKKRLEKLRGR
jgi:hypothetical protein